MTTPTTPPVDLQAIEARCEGLEENEIVPLPVFRVRALLSLSREKDQVIERLERELAEWRETYMDERGTTWIRPTAEAYYRVCKARDTLKAGQEARELAIMQFGRDRGGWTSYTTEALLQEYNATHSGEKMK
jgi:hypothetical protein